MTVPQFKSAYKILKRKSCIEFYSVLSIKNPGVRNVKKQYMKINASPVLVFIDFMASAVFFKLNVELLQTDKR